VLRRALPEHLILPLQDSPLSLPLPLPLQLTQPRWAVVLGWLALGFAWAALVLSAAWQGWLPGWALGLGVVLSVLAHYAFEQRRHAWLKDRYLCFQQTPGRFATAPDSFLGTFSKNTGQMTLTPVTLQQHWTHIFGLTLRLNLHNHPHNKLEVVTLTLWRSQLPAQTFRRLNIWAAWEDARCTPLSKGETA
jgi:hypothetical protein